MPKRIAFRLYPLPPFRLDLTAWALRRRPTNIVDRFEGGTYRRVMMFGSVPVDVAVSQVQPIDEPCLEVKASSPHAVPSEAIGPVIERVLGTRIDLQGLYAKKQDNAGLGALVKKFRGLKPPRFPSVFEAVVNAVTCQQISLGAGVQLLNRLAERHGHKVGFGKYAEHAFPRPKDLASLSIEDLRELGFSSQKSRVLIEISRSVANGTLNLEDLELMDDDAALQYLDDIHGIGRWSSEYVMLRGLGRTRIFPADDAGARKSLRVHGVRTDKLDHQGITKALAHWSPFQGAMYFHLLLEGLESAGCLSPQHANGDERTEEYSRT